jgi:ABC-2 type transport system permease protein
VLISARVNDPRTAQQLAGVIIVPIMALFAGQLFGLVVINIAFVLGLALVLAALAASTIWAATRLFQREAILTRWR